MKIFQTGQVREADSYTITHEPISSLELMERAAKKCAAAIMNRFDRERRVFIFCGPGNNGGDGLVIARILHDHGYDLCVYDVAPGPDRSEDNRTNAERLKKTGVALHVFTPDTRLQSSGKDLLIDAIFGSGLNRAPEGLFALAIQQINESPGIRISIDVPSGMRIPPGETHNCIHADLTLSFQVPRLEFYIAENLSLYGTIEMIDIGLDRRFLDELESPYALTTFADARTYYRIRPSSGHKGTFGHVHVLAGSYGKTGAALLCTKAAIHIGAGLVTVESFKQAFQVIQTGVPEAMFVANSGEKHLSGNYADHIASNCIAIGPGIGTHFETAGLLEHVLRNYQNPMVIDADALNILSGHRELYSLLNEKHVLTPHPREFDRLFDPSANGYERLLKQREKSRELGCYIVLKGARTSIASPDGAIRFNDTGNSGLSTGGSGDVLTGLIAGLLAQGYPPENACCLAVYLHGKCAETYLEEGTEETMSASDIIRMLPRTFRNFLGKDL